MPEEKNPIIFLGYLYHTRRQLGDANLNFFFRFSAFLSCHYLASYFDLNDPQAKVWDVSRCKLLQTLEGHSAAVFAVDMDEEGTLVITGSADRVG